MLLSEADRPAVREEVQAKLSKFEVGGILHLSAEMLIGSGRKDPRSVQAALPSSTQPALFDSRFADLLACPSIKGPLEYDPATGALISRLELGHVVDVLRAPIFTLPVRRVG